MFISLEEVGPASRAVHRPENTVWFLVTTFCHVGEAPGSVGFLSLAWTYVSLYTVACSLDTVPQPPPVRGKEMGFFALGDFCQPSFFFFF